MSPGHSSKVTLNKLLSQRCPWPSEWNSISSILTKSAANSSHLTWPNETKEKIQNHFSLISSFSSFVIKVRVNTQWVMVCTKWTFDTDWKQNHTQEKPGCVKDLRQAKQKVDGHLTQIEIAKWKHKVRTWHRLKVDHNQEKPGCAKDLRQAKHLTQIGSTKWTLYTDRKHKVWTWHRLEEADRTEE